AEAPAAGVAAADGPAAATTTEPQHRRPGDARPVDDLGVRGERESRDLGAGVPHQLDVRVLLAGLGGGPAGGDPAEHRSRTSGVAEVGGVPARRSRVRTGWTRRPGNGRRDWPTP